MSIRERATRDPMGRERTWGKKLDMEYGRELFAAGRRLLDNVGAKDVLDELAEAIIKPTFDDVRVEPRVRSGNLASLRISWDFHESQEPNDPRNMGNCNVVDIDAHPYTDEIVVIGNEEEELLKKADIIANPKILEDAVWLAYENPVRHTISSMDKHEWAVL